MLAPILAWLACRLVARALGMHTVGPWYAWCADLLGGGVMFGAYLGQHTLRASAERRLQSAEQRIERLKHPRPFDDGAPT